MNGWSLKASAALAIAAAVSGSLPPTVATAQVRTSGATLAVAVYANGYVAADVAFANLDVLEVLVHMVNPTVLQLDACGPDAAPALLAATERFGGSRLELRVLAGTEGHCRAAQANVLVPAGSATSAPSDATVRYWKARAP